MEPAFKSSARIEKGPEGSFDFYDDRNGKIGRAVKNDPLSLERLYRSLRDAYEAGCLTEGKYEQFGKIVRMRFGYEPPAEERKELEQRDRAHRELVARL
ncbi:MAG: hypothetical protein AABX53_04455 [Nanoarchaeota archaeon]